MTTRITYELTRQDLVEHRSGTASQWNRSEQFSRLTDRRRMLTSLCFGGGIAFFGWLQGHLFLIPIGMIGAAIYAYFLPRWSSKSHKKSLAALFADTDLEGAVGTHVIEIDGDGLTTHSRYSDARISWEGLQHIGCDDDKMVLWLNDLSSIVIPRQSVIDGDFDAFTDTVRTLSAGRTRRALAAKSTAIAPLEDETARSLEAAPHKLPRTK